MPRLVRRLAPLASVALLAACSLRSPITERITLDLAAPGAEQGGEHGGVIKVTTETRIEQDLVNQGAMHARIDAARETLAAGRDDWSVRFARVSSDSERVVLDRQKGVLQRVEHSAELTPEELQTFFADMPLTIQITRANGEGELTIYPAASTRATREERETFRAALDLWSTSVAKYLEAMNELYVYLDAHVQRAEDLFRALVRDQDDAPMPVDKEEHALVDTARDAMSAILSVAPTSEAQQYSYEELADHVYNPFPGTIAVHLPGQLLSVENFQRTGNRSVEIETTDLLSALRMLDQHWISPDPLAQMVTDANRAEGEKKDPPDPVALAALPRRSQSAVSPDDIRRALIEQLRPAATYRVRWSE